MKVTLPSGELAAVIARIIPAIPPKSTLFVLEHALLDVRSDMLEVTGTDQELTITAHTPAYVSSPGRILIPARKFYDIVRALPDEGTVELEVDGTMFRILTANGHYDLTTLSAEEYPQIAPASHAGSVNISSTDARELAQATTYAASSDQYRLALTGIHIELGTHLIAVATDGYRLAAIEIPIDSTVRETLSAIVPSRAIEQLSKLDGDVTLGIGRTHAVVVAPNMTVTTRLIDESFPNWRTVIPTGNDKVAVIDRSELLKSVRRVAILTTATSQLIRFRFDQNTLTVSTKDPETGAMAEEHLTCQYTGEAIEIGFNHKYISEALGHIPSDRVRFLLSSPSRAALIQPDEELQYRITTLIMPMRLN